MNGKLIHIAITSIALDRFELRQSVTPESVTDLVTSIQTDGLLQPIVVTPKTQGSFSLVAGRRRLTAFQVLKHDTIPAWVIDTPDLLEIPALAENLCRKQMTPLEEARALYRMHTEKEISIRELADRMHRSRTWINDRMALLQLDPALQHAVDEGVLSIGGAMQLALITDPEHRNYYLHICRTNGATVQQCEAYYQTWKCQQHFTQPAHQPSNGSQPPPEPPPRTRYCYTCESSHPEAGFIFVGVCPGCQDIFQKAKTQPLPFPQEQKPSEDAPGTTIPTEPDPLPTPETTPPEEPQPAT